MTEKYEDIKKILEVLKKVNPAIKIESCDRMYLKRVQLLSSTFLPQELQNWLRLCNGLTTNSLTLFALPTIKQSLLDEHHAKIMKNENWIPVGHDKMLNLYVIKDSQNSHLPVYLIDLNTSKVITKVSDHFPDFLRQSLLSFIYYHFRLNNQEQNKNLLKNSKQTFKTNQEHTQTVVSVSKKRRMFFLKSILSKTKLPIFRF